jgi:ABC-type antimicrobial peptide transport system permease subunit
MVNRTLVREAAITTLIGAICGLAGGLYLSRFRSE